MALPPKPRSRPERAGILTRLRLFRQDIFASQPDRLYDAMMAETRTPLYRSFLVNDPALLSLVLNERPRDFPKSRIIGGALAELLGRSVFVTNGEEWARQRRLIDPAFEGGRLRDSFPAMLAACDAAADRLAARADGTPVEIEAEASHLAADIIFRALFSRSIEDETAAATFRAFRAYQRAQPLLSPLDLMRAPRWLPRPRPAAARTAAREIRALLATLVAGRQAEIAAGTAPDDIATRILTARDPESGEGFGAEEMADQVAIFFLAGHETSASALAWALYLLATHPEAQDALAAEAAALGPAPGFGAIRTLPFTRDVFRETLRLYPPVPMMVRETVRAEVFRKRRVPRGSLVILSPWHLHRHRRLWADPDAFDPGRWATEAGKACARDAWMPFSAGPRVCTGAAFAMLEGTLALARLAARFRLSPVPGRVPRPVAHLTVRAAEGIWLSLSPRGPGRDPPA